VNYLIRQVIQIGFLAALWAIAGLATWFLMPSRSAYVLFDTTVGPMYTHVIYDTLLSRIRLRERMAKTSNIEIMFPPKPQEKPDINGGQWGPSVSNEPNDAISVATTLNLSPGAADTPRLGGGTFEHDDLEATRAPVGLPDTRFEPSYSPC